MLASNGEIQHRPGRDATVSAPKSVFLMAMVDGQKTAAATSRHDTSRNQQLLTGPPGMRDCLRHGERRHRIA